MTPLATIVALALLHLMGAVTPGPNTLVVGYLSASRSRRAGVVAAAGVALGTASWVTLSLAGFGLLVAEVGWLYGLVRAAGAAYLIWLGTRLLLSARHGRPAGQPVGRHAAPRGRSGHPFVQGLLTNLGNPKSAIFWTSLFVVAVPPGTPFWVLPTVAVVVTVQAFAWYALVALTLSTGAVRLAYLRAVRWIDVATGGLMVAIGLWLLARLALDPRRA